jgi:hypothetical protein
MPSPRRDDFRSPVGAALAERSGYLCATCRAVTIGPSSDSPLSVTNLGVAAHITTAAPRGPRFDSSLTSEQHRAIENGIWLCQTDAKRIDSDSEASTCVGADNAIEGSDRGQPPAAASVAEALQHNASR